MHYAWRSYVSIAAFVAEAVAEAVAVAVAEAVAEAVAASAGCEMHVCITHVCVMTPSCVTDADTKVTWASSKTHFPFKPRDFVTRCHYTKMKDGTYVVLTRSEDIEFEVCLHVLAV